MMKCSRRSPGCDARSLLHYYHHSFNLTYCVIRAFWAPGFSVWWTQPTWKLRSAVSRKFSRIQIHNKESINWTSDINSSQTPHTTTSYDSFKHEVDHYGSCQHLSLWLSFRARGWMTSSDGEVSGTRVSFHWAQTVLGPLPTASGPAAADASQKTGFISLRPLFLNHENVTSSPSYPGFNQRNR